MAKLTVEDCLVNTNNRFDLLLQAAKRARQIERGGTPHSGFPPARQITVKSYR